jgi:hypothetical protein
MCWTNMISALGQNSPSGLHNVAGSNPKEKSERCTG